VFHFVSLEHFSPVSFYMTYLTVARSHLATYRQIVSSAFQSQILIFLCIVFTVV
jgi:hypothetical protein